MTEESYESTIIIFKPREKLFPFITNPANFPLWTGARKVEVVGADLPEKIGTRYKVTFSSLFTSSSSIIETVGYKVPLTWSFWAEKPNGTFSYVLEPKGEDTKVTLGYTASKESGFVVDTATKISVDNLLLRLKRYLERHNV
jgi:uncharacterized protein YndB with AHSA1/START domain